MSVLTAKPIMRWIVPISAAVAVAGGGLAIGLVAANADRGHTAPDATTLLGDLQSARLDGLTGTIVQTSNLGLPALPGVPGGLSALGSGTHTLKVWYASPKSARLAVMGPDGETDVVTNGSDLWVWSSLENTATHSKLPAKAAGNDASGAKGPSAMPSIGAFTPSDLAGLALKLLGPTTDVSTQTAGQIAGRNADELVLAPKDASSTIASIRLAIDADQHIPLRVQLFARGMTDPAFEVKFTQISFTKPGAEQFTFNPPPGATVKEQALPDAKAPDAKAPGTKAPGGKGLDANPLGSLLSGSGNGSFAIVGTPGWSMVLVTKLPANMPPVMTAVLNGLPTVSGSWGQGHLLQTNVVNVLVTDDGRVLVGAVAKETLLSAAADPKAKIN
jgi:outer membrane lipoprotein-sorting protein